MFGTGVAAMVKRLEGHAGGHRAVADHGHHLARIAALAQRECHAERGARRRARMAHAERVVVAFFAPREGGESIELADRAQLVAAPGQHLVRVGLVAHVPDDAILGRVVDVMERDGEFHRAEPGGEMAADAAHRFDQIGAQLLGNRLQTLLGQGAKIGG